LSIKFFFMFRLIQHLPRTWYNTLITVKDSTKNLLG
jgi:hypothetical protein